jgi:hypothetical protein
MKTIRDFCCGDCGTVTEKYLDSSIRTIECPECFGNATQLMSMPTVKLEGITGSFPGAAEKWARVREDHARIKAKRT